MEWIDQGTVKWIKGEFDGLMKGEWMDKVSGVDKGLKLMDKGVWIRSFLRATILKMLRLLCTVGSCKSVSIYFLYISRSVVLVNIIIIIVVIIIFIMSSYLTLNLPFLP